MNIIYWMTIRNIFNLLKTVVIVAILVHLERRFYSHDTESPEPWTKRQLVPDYDRPQSKHKPVDDLEVDGFHRWMILTIKNQTVPVSKWEDFAFKHDLKLLVVSLDGKPAQQAVFKDTILFSDRHRALWTQDKISDLRVIARLFVIKNCARFIFETSDEYNLESMEMNFNFDQYDMGLIFSCHNYRDQINVDAHFGQPVAFYSNSTTVREYKSGIRKASLVQYALVNEHSSSEQGNISYDKSSPSVQLPLYKLWPQNSTNALYFYDAFWSMYQPESVSIEHKEILRSYWTQRLLWLIDGQVSIYPSKTYQNVHSPRSFVNSTLIEQLLGVLYRWKCSSARFYDCVVHLTIELALNRIWDLKEIDTVQQWLALLDRINYKEPKIKRFELEKKYDLENQSRDHCESFNSTKYSRVNYVPASGVYSNSKEYLEAWCGVKLGSNRDVIIGRESKSKYSLIIDLTGSQFSFERLLTLKHLYQKLIQHIVFCGVENMIDTYSQLTKLGLHSFSLIEMTWNHTSYDNMCMTKAIELNLNTLGYLYITESTLFRLWNFNPTEVNLFMVWSNKNLTPIFDRINKLASQNSYKMQDKSTMTLVKFYLNSKTYKSSLADDVSIINLVEYALLVQRNGELEGVANRGYHWFYLPRNRFNFFHLAATLYRSLNITSEATTNALLAMLSHGNNLVLSESNNYDEFNRSSIVIGPVDILKTPRVSFCKRFIANMFKKRL